MLPQFDSFFNFVMQAGGAAAKRLTDLPELVVAYILSFCASRDLVGSVELCCSSPLLHRDLRLLRLGPR